MPRSTSVSPLLVSLTLVAFGCGAATGARDAATGSGGRAATGGHPGSGGAATGGAGGGGQQGGGGAGGESTGGGAGGASTGGVSGSGGGGAAGGGPADAGVDGAKADAGPPDGDVCAAVLEGAACSEDGRTCTRGCADACQFCNIFRCMGGKWQRQESFPAPCFACGPSLRCQVNAQYCYSVVGGVLPDPTYQCRATPTACLPTPTCTCLRAQSVSGNLCTEAAAGQLTTTLQAP